MSANTMARVAERLDMRVRYPSRIPAGIARLLRWLRPRGGTGGKEPGTVIFLILLANLERETEYRPDVLKR